MHVFATILSYLAFVLLLMPSDAAGIIQSAVLFVPGAALILWKKPGFVSAPVTGRSFWTAVLPTAFLGLLFVNQWAASSRVQALAGMLHLPSGAVAAAAAVFFCACAFRLVHGAVQKAAQLAGKCGRTGAANALLCCISAFVTVLLPQIMLGVDLFSMGFVRFACGWLIVLVVVVLLYCLIKNVKWAVLLGTGLFMVIATINVYVYEFRGRLFEPVDVVSMGTAMNVVDNYQLFPIPDGIMIGWGLWIAVVYLLTVCLKPRFVLRGWKRGIAALCSLIAAVSVFGYANSLQTYHWINEGALFNGYILDFASKFKEAWIEKPEGYSPEEIHQLAQQYAEPELPAASASKPPHVIVIMNEAFADLNVVGKVNTNMPVTPFISSLKEDVVSGHTLVSVYGGNTANSEYEFLTGNSMAWLTPNVVPYQQYIRSSAYSMVSWLKANYGYHCVSMHPYMAECWNRTEAYRHLGFDESLFFEDFPQKQFIRSYTTDQEMFETIVASYEEHREQPLFIFGMSMQNHGGYTYTGADFEPKIFLEGYERAYPDVEQYLTLIHETDKAVEYLITYLENVDDDVVVVFLGDHQPKIDDAFYEEIAGHSLTSLDEMQEKYLVPFFIWANYDIEEKQVECTSLSYLSSWVYEAAGIAQPPYNRFLLDMAQTIPAVNANGFYSLEAEGYLKLDEGTAEEQKWLKKYEQLQYNSLFDTKNRDSSLFPVLEP